MCTCLGSFYGVRSPCDFLEKSLMLFIFLLPSPLLPHHNLSLLSSRIPFEPFIPCIPDALCDEGTRQMKTPATCAIHVLGRKMKPMSRAPHWWWVKEEEIGKQSGRHAGVQGWKLEGRWPRKAYNYVKNEVRSRRKLKRWDLHKIWGKSIQGKNSSYQEGLAHQTKSRLK